MSPENDEIEGIIPEAEEFVNEVNQRKDLENDPIFSEQEGGEYGHAVRGLAHSAMLCALNRHSPEYQRNMLKQRVQEIVTKFGPNIIPLLRDELKLALSEDDLTPKDT